MPMFSGATFAERLLTLRRRPAARHPLGLWGFAFVCLSLAGCTQSETIVGAQLPCAPDTECLKVDANGKPNSDGTSIAQCGAAFPDYIVEASLFPSDYQGPWFKLSQDFPDSPPTEGDLPWTTVNFRESKQEADKYLYALRDYSFEGMIEADFRPQDNSVRAWYHIPLMNYRRGRREFVHGLTEERPLQHPELGIKQRVTVRNFAIGFYNDRGGYTAGQVWAEPNNPALAKSIFEEGTMVFKILFTAAVPDDFENPDDYLVEGAPEWQIATSGSTTLTTVRLLQMDVAVRDQRAGASGWNYGTFAFDRDADDPNPWNRLRPVGLMWGNDPGYTPANQQAGVPLEEAYISDQIPKYAAGHLGWAGRVNGPVDNPISACTSCHATAQYPVDAALAPFSAACKTDEQKLHWFRNFAGDVAFGAVDTNTCLPKTVDPPPVALDTSLQMQVAAQNLLQFGSINPCVAEADTAGAMAMPRSGSPARTTDAPAVER